MRPLFYPLNRASLSLLILLLLSTLTFQSQAQSGSVTTTQSFSYTGQIVTWTVPTGVTSLTVEARGAEGSGGTTFTYAPGKGAIIRGALTVTPSQALSILVGQQPTQFTRGGGGGSFVVTGSNSIQPLIVAGGGGGGGGVYGGTNSGNYDSNSKEGQTANNAGKGTGPTSSGGSGGTTGGGGNAGSGQVNAAGGGGLIGNGQNGGFPGGKSLVNGGAGGSGSGVGSDQGGFGGGGSSNSVIDGLSSYAAGGGGGGYTGGGGGSYSGGGAGVGGGGGSYNAGTLLTAVAGANSGNGLVTITYAVPTQPIRYVKAGGTGDGTSWANASGDLQSQIDIAGAEQVWVAGGIYKPGPGGNTNRGISFVMKNGVAIYGGFVGNETSPTERPFINPLTGQPSSTTLSGEIGDPSSRTDNSNTVVRNSGLTNTARLDGFVISDGQTSGSGAGVRNDNSSPTLLNLLFTRNRAGSGGGIANINNSTPSISNCLFSQNIGSDGGGMANQGASPVLTNCSFSQSTAVNGGGMFNSSNSTPQLTNCSFSRNTANFGGGIVIQNSNANLINCILWDNGGQNAIFSPNRTAVTANYCLIEPAETDYTGTNNRALDPLFVDASAGNLQLQPCSPAIDAGDNSVNTTPTDLAGNNRRQRTIDMGAYEFQGTPNSSVAITQQPASGSSVCAGSTVTAMVSATGTSPTYQWYKDGVALTGVASATTATLTLTNVQPADAGSYAVIVTGSCPGSVTSTAFSLTVTNPQPPTLVTQTGGPYPAGVSSLTISQNVGDVILTASGCPGGTITWNGGMATTLAVSTVSTGTQTFSATCQQNGCTSPTATATVTVVPASLRVLHREATNNDLFTTAIKPYLILENTGNQPIPYQQITVRYWLTVENPAPLTNLPVYYADLGTSLVHPAFVPISPTRTGASGYVEYRFDPAAGSLAPLSNSGRIENGISKADYSPFNQADDYSFVLNRDYTPNQRITAYVDGQIVWGQEPAVPGTTPPSPLQVTASATSPVIPTTANTTLVATPQGGSGSYAYAFSGPGQLAPNGNTAVAANLPAGVQTFTITVTDTSVPTAQMATATVSVTVTGPPNSAPTPGVNASQTATVGTMFAYTVAAFTDAETPGSLTYTARLSPANRLTFNPATRVITGTPTLTGETSVTITATDPGGLSASTVFTITAIPAPNSAPTPGVNASQTATVGTRFAYTANAFGDAQTPTSLTYTATITPGNNLIFDPATRVVSGTPSLSGVVSVTITATDPGGLSTSTTFTITVNPAPVVAGPATLRVLHRDASNGQLITNAIYPYLILENTGSTAIPYQQITVRYWLTVETPAPLTNLVVYSAEVGAGNVRMQYVASPRQGATGYVEYSFTTGAGSLGALSNSGVIANAISKQDYSGFDQADDYSYALNRDFTPNTRITAYLNGSLVYGTEPPSAVRLGLDAVETPLAVRVLGNPVVGSEMVVEITGAAGQSLQLRVTDLAGHAVSEQQVERAGSVEQQRLRLGQQPAGLLLLHVSTPGQTQTVKVLKLN